MRRWPSAGSWPASTKSLINGGSASKECRRWSAIIAWPPMHLELTDEETQALKLLARGTGQRIRARLANAAVARTMRQIDETPFDMVSSLSSHTAILNPVV